MSASLAFELVSIEESRGKATGSKSVGGRMRSTIILCADKLGWPIDANRIVVDAAAPKAVIGTGAAPRKAGVLPLAVKCHMEWLAAATPGKMQRAMGCVGIRPEAAAVIQFYARSLLAANIDQFRSIHSVPTMQGEPYSATSGADTQRAYDEGRPARGLLRGGPTP